MEAYALWTFLKYEHSDVSPHCGHFGLRARQVYRP